MPKPVQQKLHDILTARQDAGNIRTLTVMDGVDFCSNDYLGLARTPLLPAAISGSTSGSTGSRLINGHSHAIQHLEQEIATFHKAEAALLFGSGYSANLGLLSAIGAKEDVLICDDLIHASLIDGARLAYAERVRFAHNDIEDLETKLAAYATHTKGSIFVVVESVYSMDGDIAPLRKISALCEKFGAALIVDEAHAIGIYGAEGRGMINALGLEGKVFAGIYTYGKAMGLHGATIVGSKQLTDYLINFCRPFIYTTAPSPQSVENIKAAYQRMQNAITARADLSHIIDYFLHAIKSFSSPNTYWLQSQTPIQGLIVPGNKNAKALTSHLQTDGFAIKAILSPTVPAGQERLRLSLHSYNTQDEVDALMLSIAGYFKEHNQ